MNNLFQWLILKLVHVDYIEPHYHEYLKAFPFKHYNFSFVYAIANESYSKQFFTELKINSP